MLLRLEEYELNFGKIINRGATCLCCGGIQMDLGLY